MSPYFNLHHTTIAGKDNVEEQEQSEYSFSQPTSAKPEVKGMKVSEKKG